METTWGGDHGDHSHGGVGTTWGPSGDNGDDVGMTWGQRPLCGDDGDHVGTTKSLKMQ